MKDINKKEAEGVNHKNFAWEGWDDLELHEAYLKEAKDRRKTKKIIDEIESEDIRKEKKLLVETEPRNFQEARERRESQNAGLDEKFEWDVEHGGLTDEERYPLKESGLTKRFFSLKI